MVKRMTYESISDHSTDGLISTANLIRLPLESGLTQGEKCLNVARPDAKIAGILNSNSSNQTPNSLATPDDGPSKDCQISMHESRKVPRRERPTRRRRPMYKQQRRNQLLPLKEPLVRWNKLHAPSVPGQTHKRASRPSNKVHGLERAPGRTHSGTQILTPQRGRLTPDSSHSKQLARHMDGVS